MPVIWIVLLSIVGALELIGLGLVVHDLWYYRWKDRETSISDGKS